MHRTPLMTLAECERVGMWLRSELGVSFSCRCGWTSGISTNPADVRALIEAHLLDPKADDRG